MAFVDALFLSMSGLSTSGLSTVDVGKGLSAFGQVVLLVDFQVGGLGYMTFFVVAAQLLGRGLRMNQAHVARESLVGATLADVARFFRWVALTTLFFEGLGAAVLTVCWMDEYPFGRALYFGVFHSISAFCTAGFGLLSDNLVSRQADWVVNVTISVVSLAGGIGFLVMADIWNWFRRRELGAGPRRLSVHTKLALAVTALVMLAGTAVIYAAEKWPASWTTADRLRASAFQPISASTTDGFNTVDIGAMSATSLLAMILLMFIGASPGSTGGGIKTTTLGVLWVSAWAQFRQKDAELCRRRIPVETQGKAVAILMAFLIVALADALVLAATEKGSFLQVLFEIVSALGNTGLSTGITADLSTVGKVLLTVTMFIGRVGPLALGMSLMARRRPARYRYAEADVFVG
jgi:trk system potassium uptake protein TrkH